MSDPFALLGKLFVAATSLDRDAIASAVVDVATTPRHPEKSKPSENASTAAGEGDGASTTAEDGQDNQDNPNGCGYQGPLGKCVYHHAGTCTLKR